MCFRVAAQTDTTFVDRRPTVLGAYLDYGYILKHAPSLEQIPNAYPTAIGLEWSKMLLTEHAFDFCNCFPRVGVDLAYWNFDNAEVLGSGLLAMGFVEPYFRTQKRTNFFIRAGLGGAYLTQPYDEVANPLNESYSTHISFALMLGFGINYQLSEYWSLKFAAKYNHTSNGGVSTPNKGLNFPSLSMGVNRSLESLVFPDLEATGKRQPPKEKTRIVLSAFTGWSNARVGYKDKFLVLWDTMRVG